MEMEQKTVEMSVDSKNIKSLLNSDMNNIRIKKIDGINWILHNSFGLKASLKTGYDIISLENDIQEENIFWLNIYVNETSRNQT